LDTKATSSNKVAASLEYTTDQIKVVVVDRTRRCKESLGRQVGLGVGCLYHTLTVRCGSSGAGLTREVLALSHVKYTTHHYSYNRQQHQTIELVRGHTSGRASERMI
jgi:hypothetical protein